MFSLSPSLSSSSGVRSPGLGEGEDCEVCAKSDGCACGEDGRWGGLTDLGRVHLSSGGAERDRERSLRPPESRKDRRTH